MPGHPSCRCHSIAETVADKRSARAPETLRRLGSLLAARGCDARRSMPTARLRATCPAGNLLFNQPTIWSTRVSVGGSATLAPIRDRSPISDILNPKYKSADCSNFGDNRDNESDSRAIRARSSSVRLSVSRHPPDESQLHRDGWRRRSSTSVGRGGCRPLRPLPRTTDRSSRRPRRIERRRATLADRRRRKLRPRNLNSVAPIASRTGRATSAAHGEESNLHRNFDASAPLDVISDR